MILILLEATYLDGDFNSSFGLDVTVWRDNEGLSADWRVRAGLRGEQVEMEYRDSTDLYYDPTNW